MRRAHTTPAPTLATADSSAACSSATCPSRQAVSASSVATANSRCLPSSWESAGRHCETAAGSRQQASEWADGGCELGATDQTQGPADSQMMACAQVWAGSLASWVQCSAVQCSAVQAGAPCSCRSWRRAPASATSSCSCRSATCSRSRRRSASAASAVCARAAALMSSPSPAKICRGGSAGGVPAGEQPRMHPAAPRLPARPSADFLSPRPCQLDPLPPVQPASDIPTCDSTFQPSRAPSRKRKSIASLASHHSALSRRASTILQLGRGQHGG